MPGTPILNANLAHKVKAARAAATGTLVGGQCVLKGLHFNDSSGGTPGSVVLRDGGSGGTVVLTIDTPGGGTGEDVMIPAGGMDFETDMHVTLTNVDNLTVFYFR